MNSAPLDKDWLLNLVSGKSMGASAPAVLAPIVRKWKIREGKKMIERNKEEKKEIKCFLADWGPLMNWIGLIELTILFHLAPSRILSNKCFLSHDFSKDF